MCACSIPPLISCLILILAQVKSYTSYKPGSTVQAARYVAGLALRAENGNKSTSEGSAAATDVALGAGPGEDVDADMVLARGKVSYMFTRAVYMCSCLYLYM